MGMASDSLKRYKFQRLLKALKEKLGRGTELISLYIPPGRNVFEVGSYLRHEQDQAGNIKDKLTRKNVQTSIEKLVQHLKLYKETPSNGLALFCGAVARGPVRGTEEIEMHVVDPPEPIKSFIYHCDHAFHLEPLEEMAKEKDVYGLLVLDRGGGVIGLLRGANYTILDKVDSDVPPKHSAGGWSQRRFERIREEKVHEFFKKFGERAGEDLLPHLRELKGIVVGGAGDARELFASGDYLHYKLREKVIANVPLGYDGEQGVRELIRRAESVLRGTTLLEEKIAVEEALGVLAKDPGLVAYSLKDVISVLKSGAAERVIAVDDLDQLHITKTCEGCGLSEDLVRPSDLDSVDMVPCSRCGSTSFKVETEDVLDYLASLAETTSASVTVISSRTEWGEQLRALGGVLAILRYSLT